MKTLRVTALATIVLFTSIAQAATNIHVITDNPGGVIPAHIKRYSGWAKAGDKVVIDGKCNSACTMLLGIIKPANICVTPNAALGFHSGSLWSVLGGTMFNRRYDREATLKMRRYHPQWVRDALRTMGWNGISDHEDIIVVPFETAAKHMRVC